MKNHLDSISIIYILPKIEILIKIHTSLATLNLYITLQIEIRVPRRSGRSIKTSKLLNITRLFSAIKLSIVFQRQMLRFR